MVTEGLGEYFTSILLGEYFTSVLSMVAKGLGEYFTSVLSMVTVGLGESIQVHCLWSPWVWVNQYKCIVYDHRGVW